MRPRNLWLSNLVLTRSGRWLFPGKSLVDRVKNIGETLGRASTALSHYGVSAKLDRFLRVSRAFDHRLIGSPRVSPTESDMDRYSRYSILRVRIFNSVKVTTLYLDICV